MTNEYCQNSDYNTLLRYWEMFCVMYNMILLQSTPLNEDIAIIFELCKMLNFKVNSTCKFLKPSKELFENVKYHCNDTLLKLLICDHNQVTESQEDLNLKTITSNKNKNYKALILPSNNGKLVSNVLRRRTWWKIDKNKEDYDLIWTPLIRKGNTNLSKKQTNQ